jgi:putative tricarboxylic transport membrane protein
LGLMMIRGATFVLRAPRAAIMSVIVLLTAVGAFAITNSLFAVLTVAFFGALGYVMERNGYPVAALILGLVMGASGGGAVEQHFVASLIKSDGSPWPFFSRPVAAILAAMTIAAILWPVGVWIVRRMRRGRAVAAR